MASRVAPRRSAGYPPVLFQRIAPRRGRTGLVLYDVGTGRRVGSAVRVGSSELENEQSNEIRQQLDDERRVFFEEPVKRGPGEDEEHRVSCRNGGGGSPLTVEECHLTEELSGTDRRHGLMPPARIEFQDIDLTDHDKRHPAPRGRFIEDERSLPREKHRRVTGEDLEFPRGDVLESE